MGRSEINTAVTFRNKPDYRWHVVFMSGCILLLLSINALIRDRHEREEMQRFDNEGVKTIAFIDELDNIAPFYKGAYPHPAHVVKYHYSDQDMQNHSDAHVYNFFDFATLTPNDSIEILYLKSKPAISRFVVEQNFLRKNFADESGLYPALLYIAVVITTLLTAYGFYRVRKESRNNDR